MAEPNLKDFLHDLKMRVRRSENKIPKTFICIRLRPKSNWQFIAWFQYRKNLSRAKIAARYAVLNGYDPEATTIYFTQFLDDSMAEERELGMKIGQSRLELCNEIWDIRDADEKPSSGMASDLKFAGENNIAVKGFDFDMIKTWVENYDKTSQ